MDGTRFDAIIKGLSTNRVTRLDAVRGLAASAVATIAGVTLFSERTEARDTSKGPKSNPKGKKKSICHCAGSSAASCKTIKPRRKSAKKHLKHSCDYAGPCVAGKSGCPAGATVVTG